MNRAYGSIAEIGSGAGLNAAFDPKRTFNHLSQRT